MTAVSMTVNGKPVSADIEDRTLLVYFLRENLRLTGTHIGCDTSQCGACVIHIDGKAVKSCSVFAVAADGASVTTIEGLAKDGKLHPVQEAFRENHGLQCGFCTPGMIMTAVDMINRKGAMDRETIRHELEGNICRCTGYVNIVTSIEDASKRIAAGEERRRMIPYQFTYKRARSLAEAETLLGASPDAKLLAGGQTLIATMKMRLANPSDLIDISGIKELSYIRLNGGTVTIGAATTHYEVATSAEIQKAP